MKHFILPIALGLALVSCNRDNGGEGNLPAETPILPVKIVAGEDDYTEFKYNGDKLSEIITKDEDVESRSVVEYTGDFITSITSYEKGVKEGKTTFRYDNGKLVESIRVGLDENGTQNTETTTYQYSNDGTITKTHRWGNNTGTYVVKVANGNVMQYDRDGITIKYKYDTKNSPFKNVKGMSAFVANAVDESNVNNIIEEVSVDSRDNFSYKYIYTYDYNANNFPTKQVKTKEGEAKTYTTTYTYNK